MSPPPWQAMIFDFGGTLDGDGVHWSRRFDRAFRNEKLDYTDEALNAAFRAAEDRMNADPGLAQMGLAESIRLEAGLMLWHLGFPESARADRCAEWLTGETRDYLKRNFAVLEALQGRTRLGILSNFTGNLELILREEGYLDVADAVYDSSVVGLRKPDTAFFQGLLKELGAAPGKSAMVGDSVDMDLKPARELGMTTLWVEGEFPRTTDFGPDYTLRSVTQISELWPEGR